MLIDPNFLFIGGGRCASTWVHECLKEHPDVLVPAKTKEVRFFNRDENYERGLDWYRQFFVDHNGQKAVGEVTPSYLCSSPSPGRIHTHYPGIRMILSLRNPVDRAYSSYKGNILKGKVMDGEDIIEASRRIVFDDQSSIIDQGFYYDQIQAYLKFFTRDQMLILIYEDLGDDPTAFIRAIYRFLGVDDTFVPDTVRRRVNQNFESGTLQTSVIRKLSQFGLLFKPRLPRIHRACELAVFQLRNRTVQRESTTVPPEIRKQLGEIYHDGNRKLAAFLGRDLSIWD